MKTADKIIKSQTVFTALEKTPFAGAVAVSGNKIMDVVKGDVPSEWIGDNTKIYDCGDDLVMPGFIDAHTHFFMGTAANSRYMNMEIENSTSEDDCIRMMKEYEKKNPDLKRLLGWGWFPANWDDAPLPTKESLDKAFPDKEVILYCADGHTVWLNSNGLKACNIDRNTVPPYGEVVKGPDGEPNGILMEGAGLVALEKLSDFPIDVMKEIYSDFFSSIAKKGITSVSDMTITEMNQDYLDLFERLKQMEKSGDITARLNMYSRLGPEDNYDAEVSLRKKYGKDGIVRYAGFKHLVDGVTSTFTGLLLEPYSDAPETSGDPANYEKEYYVKHVVQANAVDIGVRLHCIGDRAVRWALDAFEEANKVTGNDGNKKHLKNSVEHVETIHPDDIPRFSKLGVIPSMQPYHLTLDNNEKIRRCGLERCRWEWPHRSFLDSGAILAFGTDYPIVNFDPFENIYSAVTRNGDDRKPTGVNPEEKISLAEALICYTANGAYAYDMEDELGTLEAGKLADIIVIDRNMFEIPDDEIPECNVRYTFFNGDEIYAAE